LPSVSIGPFVSDTDEAERDREKHETRRLLAVALTRARDRLYLSSVLKINRWCPAVEACGVMPDSFKNVFNHAATAFEQCPVVGWTGASGRAYNWRICRPPSTPTATIVNGQAGEVVTARQDRFGPVADESLLRRSVTQWLDETGEVDSPRRSGSRSVTAGTLVHRLFQSSVGDDDRDDPEVLAVARGLLTANERASVGDVDAVVAAAVGAWRSLRSRKDVAALLAGERVLYEVPFSMTSRRRQDRQPLILRGAIDCLVKK
jgi:hypothetical protein